MKYGSLNAAWDRQNFLSFWAIFCPFTPFFALPLPYRPRKSKFWNEKKHLQLLPWIPWMTMIWCMVPEIGTATDILDYFILARFFPFYPPPPPLTTWKIKILKNEKTPGDIMLHKCTKNHDHMLLFFKIRCVTDVIFIFHFGLFFVLPPRHPTIQKIKI